MLSCLVVSNSLQPHGLKFTRLLCPWDSPDKNTGVDGHFLLQGIFPTQGLNAHLHLLRWQEGSLPLCYLGSLFKHKTWYHKTPKESTGKIFSDINHTNVFLSQSPRPIEIKTKINKCSLIKLISFCTPKKTIKKNENATYEPGENICKWCNWQWLSF